SGGYGLGCWVTADCSVVGSRAGAAELAFAAAFFADCCLAALGLDLLHTPNQERRVPRASPILMPRVKQPLPPADRTIRGWRPSASRPCGPRNPARFWSPS